MSSTYAHNEHKPYARFEYKAKLDDRPFLRMVELIPTCHAPLPTHLVKEDMGFWKAAKFADQVSRREKAGILAPHPRLLRCGMQKCMAAMPAAAVGEVQCSNDCAVQRHDSATIGADSGQIGAHSPRGQRQGCLTS